MKIFMAMPTWNNEVMCGDAIRTLYEYTNFERYGELCVIDNSPSPGTHVENMCAKYGARYRRQDENLGWMRSINKAHQDYPAQDFELFTMCNDDVVFPQDPEFWPRTITLFEEDDKVAGVGPISNYVMGWQFHHIPITDDVGLVELLVGFCATYRNSALAEVGLLDHTLPGGDDLDLSIRMRIAGYKLLCDRRSFLHHYGSVTGNRVHSDWDSLQSQHKTMNALIRKHGMKAWYGCVQGPWTTYKRVTDLELSKKVMKAVSDLGTFVIHERGTMVMEGSVPPRQIESLIEEAVKANRICEVGFNLGMSAVAMMAANPKAHVTSFDIGEWECVWVGKRWIHEHYGPQHSLIVGDSKQTLPTLSREYDFAFIDGGHDYETAISDIRNLAPRSARVMVDDLQIEPVRKAWDEAVAAGLIRDVSLCTDRTTSVARIWGVGRGGK